MRKYKITSDFMLVLSLALLVGSVIIAAASSQLGDTAFYSCVHNYALIISCAGVGAFLIYSKNDIARRIGNGMYITAFVVGCICAIKTLNYIAVTADTHPEADVGTSVSAIFMIVAMVFTLLYFAFRYLFTIKQNAGIQHPEQDSRFTLVREWKKLMDDDIITAEEFEEKRQQILGLQKNENKN